MTKTKIRQSEVLKRYKLPITYGKKFRDVLNLVRGIDWWKERSIVFWSEDAMEKGASINIKKFIKGQIERKPTIDESVREIVSEVIHEPEEDEPVPFEHSHTPPIEESGIEHVRGLNLAKNPNFLYANLNGQRIAVLAGRKHAGRLQGKPFTVRADNSGTETTYHYLP